MCAGRLLDDMKFKETGELPFLDLGSFNVRVNLPLLERYSPLSYSVADHVHWDLAKHRGIETCNRISLENVCILHYYRDQLCTRSWLKIVSGVR